MELRYRASQPRHKDEQRQRAIGAVEFVGFGVLAEENADSGIRVFAGSEGFEGGVVGEEGRVGEVRVECERFHRFVLAVFCLDRYGINVGEVREVRVSWAR